MKIWKKLLQVDRVHFILVTHVVTYIRTTPTPLLLLFIPYKFLDFSSHDDEVYNNERKRKRAGDYKTAATKRLSFFLSRKAYVKRSDVAYFRVSCSKIC